VNRRRTKQLRAEALNRWAGMSAPLRRTVTFKQYFKAAKRSYKLDRRWRRALPLLPRRWNWNKEEPNHEK